MIITKEDSYLYLRFACGHVVQATQENVISLLNRACRGDTCPACITPPRFRPTMPWEWKPWSER